MNLLGIGVPEAGLIFVLTLILVGPQRFPEIARQAGRWYRMARTFSDTMMRDVRAAVDEIEVELDDVKSGGGQPIRELTGLHRDLIDALEAPPDRSVLPPPATAQAPTEPAATDPAAGNGGAGA